MAYTLKTRPTGASVGDYLAAIEDPVRRADCKALAALMRRVTGRRPAMWGERIVGFDRYRYTYRTGHRGEWCMVGFAPGRAQISLYLLSGFESSAMKALLPRLWRHKAAKSCLYIGRLSDIDVSVLEAMLAQAVIELRKRHPPDDPLSDRA